MSTQNSGFDVYGRRIADEYKLLQDKMDKIGTFRFTIKGWAIAGIGIASTAAFAILDWKAADRFLECSRGRHLDLHAEYRGRVGAERTQRTL